MNSDNLEKNEIVEIDENEEIQNTQYDMPIMEEKKIKKPKKKNPKKTKLIIIISVAVLALIIGIVLLWFLVFNREEEMPKEPVVVIEKDNYRYEDGKLILIDNNKKELGSYECINKNENLCYVAYYSNEDDFDIDKKVYENGLEVNLRSDIYKDNYVFIYDDEVKENGNIYFYDIKNKEKLGTYSLVKEVSSEQVIVKNDNEYMLLDVSKNENVLDKTYDYLGFIIDTKYLISADNNNYKLIDFDGESISKSVPGSIKNYSDKAISVSVGEKIYIYNYDGEKIINDNYSYARFIDDYIILLDSKKLYVFDSLGNKMTKDAIKIGTTDYNTKLIFSEALRQTGKEEAFSVSVNNDIMKISFEEEVVSINLLEGKFNKDLAYIDYFAGKLYFYKDLEKTKLLGSYACNYKNEVSEETEKLENCFIAIESNILKPSENLDNGYIPIYNERYVFISDTKSPNEESIVLYDLENKKAIKTYRKVDTGYHKTDSDISFIDTAGTHVVCQNTSGYYGLINIATSSVKGVISFGNNIELRLFDNYYMTKREDGTYHLYPSTGSNINDNEITKNVSTKYEIVEYKYDYLRVKNNDKYLIYDLNGKVVSGEFKYIKLEKNFYVTVDNESLLGIYKYDSKTNLLDSDIKINNVDTDIYYVVNNNVVKITHPSEAGKIIEVNLENEENNEG